jgi:uracil-DNA glycosylase
MVRKLEDFVEQLSVTQVTCNVYNQYSYDCEENKVRRDNLLIYLKKMHKLKPKILLVGEAPGYRGCRLTGVPFTSEHLLMNNMEGLKLFGRQEGYRLVLDKDKLFKEATATIIWETLLKYDMTALAWNAFPFHPHKKDDGQSNRAPLNKELIIGEKPLLQMIQMFNIKQVVAVGRKAEQTLHKLNINSHRVRHPAQGGKNEFVKGIREIKNFIKEKGL